MYDCNDVDIIYVVDVDIVKISIDVVCIVFGVAVTFVADIAVDAYALVLFVVNVVDIVTVASYAAVVGWCCWSLYCRYDGVGVGIVVTVVRFHGCRVRGVIIVVVVIVIVVAVIIVVVDFAIGVVVDVDLVCIAIGCCYHGGMLYLIILILVLSC